MSEPHTHPAEDDRAPGWFPESCRTITRRVPRGAMGQPGTYGPELWGVSDGHYVSDPELADWEDFNLRGPL